MRTAFCGTPEIAVPALRALAARTTVTTVVTQPDRPAGRGQRPQPSAVKLAAEALGLPVWQPETLRGAQDDPRLQDLDLIVVMAYGELLRQPVLDLPRGGCINLHASLLPRWRGASPLQAALRAGDERTGVTVMRMVRALDAGPVYLAEPVPIAPTTTLPELHDAIAAAAAVALERFLAAYPAIAAVPQDEAQVTLCGKLESGDGHLDFAGDAAAIERWVRAYTPAPGCWAQAPGGERVRVLAVAPRPALSDAAPGVVRVVDGELRVACGAGSIAVLRLQWPGGKPLAARDFLNGRTPPARLS